MFDITGLLGKKVSFIRDFPRENDTHNEGEVVGATETSSSYLELLVSCEDGIHPVSLDKQVKVLGS
ncbi:MAG: hypothetical protein WC694_00890 [Candidatus Paceibacterota bacterium]|jgi:hypothetical protein